MILGAAIPLALLVAAVVVLAWALVLYNGLVAARRACDRAWSNIDVLLKQRHDELPRLVEVCRAHAAFERGTLEAVMVARSRLALASTTPARTSASAEVSGAVRELFAVAERYPDLKASQGFVRLQSRISELENQIADRRELYNATVTGWNTRLEQVPGVFVARVARMGPRELWHAPGQPTP
jgi:LemA protein